MAEGRSAMLAELSARKKSPRRSFGKENSGNVMLRSKIPETPKIESKEALLRRRRMSLTPEDKENLLKSESKVMGAALSLHVIHDVPLQQLEKRLEDWGVEAEMRAKAVETIKSKTNALATKVLKEQDAARRAIGAPPLINRRRLGEALPKCGDPTPQKKTTEENDPLAKYRKMIKMGIPPAGAQAAARRDGITPELCAQLCPEESGQSLHTEEKKKASDDDTLNAYRKMLSLGVPAQAVRARMLREGVSEKDADSLCPVQKKETHVDTQKSNSGKSTSKKVQPKVKALHWQKLEEKEHKLEDTVWALSPPPEKSRRKSNTNNDSPGTTVCDDDDLALLEELFASAPPTTNTASSSSQGKAEASLKKLSLLPDSRRSANVAIGLTYFARKYGEDDSAVCRAAYAGDEWLDAPRLRSLQALLPTTEELALIQRHLSGPPMPAVADTIPHDKDSSGRRRRALERLARPERFFALCIDYPQLQRRVESGIFMDEWEEIIYTAKHAAKLVVTACEALRDSRPLAKILKALLQLGNRLNQDRDHLGAARGVALCSLERFVTAKGHDGTNLIDYLLTVLHKRQKTEQSLAFLDDMPDLNLASRHADDDLTIGAAHRLDKQFETLTKLVTEFSESSALATPLKKTSSTLNKKRNTKITITPLDAAFLERAQDTIKTAGPALQALRTQITKLTAAKNNLRIYFAEKPQTSLADIFLTLDSFLGHLKTARDKHRRRAQALERVRKRDEARAKAKETNNQAVIAKLTNAPITHQRQAEKEKPHPPDHARPAFARVQLRANAKKNNENAPPSEQKKPSRLAALSRKSTQQSAAPASKILVSKAKYAHDKMHKKYKEESSQSTQPSFKRQPTPPTVPPPPSAVVSPRSLLKMYANDDSGAPKSPDDEDYDDDDDDDTTVASSAGQRSNERPRPGAVKNRLSQGDAWWKSSTKLF